MSASFGGSMRASRSRPAGSKASPRRERRVRRPCPRRRSLGFASSYVLTTAEADRVAAEAVRIARATATALRDRAVLDDRPPAHGTFETPVEEDPFKVPLETNIADLLAADAAPQQASKASPSLSRCTRRSGSGRRSPRLTAA